ncbi:MAG TPA: hypothetical protein DCW68_00640 [Rhodospirillaceae bacterium]|nr:MAG: hypothetical protein A2018_00965 [Alphaproteobacteria bacterium GWF2_58_20]HAU28608.1 hypothetical protein [Rhodospirillaceae bacterium]
MSHSIRVVVATTEGPSEILRLTPEDPDVRSVACLGGKAIPLPISKAYDAFVREPTGVIARAFGHEAFRLDVSAPIDDGLSWQLPVFAAHALLAAQRLAMPGKAGDHVLWLTGEVDRDLRVLPVAHCLAKLDRSRTFFAESMAAGARVTVFLPQGNAMDIGACWAKRNGLDPERLRIVPVVSMEEVLQALGLAQKTGASRASRLALPELLRRNARAAWSLVAVFMVFAGMALTWHMGISDWESLRRGGQFRGLDVQLSVGGILARGYETWLASQVPADISLGIDAVRAKDGRICPDAARAERADYEIRPAPEGMALLAEGLCGLEFSMKSPEESLYLWPFVQDMKTRAFLARRPRAQDAGGSPQGKDLALALALPDDIRQQGLSCQMGILAARAPVAEAADWVMMELAAHPEENYAARWDALREKLRRRGILLQGKGCAITP